MDTPTAMDTLLTGLGTVFTKIMGLIGTTIGVVIDNPLLLLVFGIFFTGAVVGIFGRLLNTH